MQFWKPVLVLALGLLSGGCSGNTEATPHPSEPLTQESRPSQSRPTLAQADSPIASPIADGRIIPAGQDNNSLLLGNPSRAARGNTNLSNLLVERPQHAMSYNGSVGGSNWVAWHTGASDLGNMRRGTFHPDPLLPPDLQIRPNDYRGSGYDRGHVCPSADRTDTRENNDATFVMSNMLPQAPALNQQVWKKLEDYSRSLIRRGNELYTIAGGLGTAGRIAGGKVNVPAFCWKIIVVLPEGKDDLQRISAQTRVITVLMPNQDTPEVSGARWAKYLTSVATLEKQTGYDFLSALPDDIEHALEQKTDSGRATDTASPATEEPSEASTIAIPTPGAPGVVRGVTPVEARQSRPEGEPPREPPQPQSPAVQQPAAEQPVTRDQPAAQDQSATDGQVWVNTKSGVYHYPGARWYGNTKRGEYMTEAQALAQGYHAAQNGQ